MIAYELVFNSFLKLFVVIHVFNIQWNFIVNIRDTRPTQFDSSSWYDCFVIGLSHGRQQDSLFLEFVDYFYDI